VAGQFDLVAILRARDDDQFAQIVTEGMLKVEGIKSSETLIAFRAYSRHDLERLFSVGMEAS
jgi:DNA-binding Lrp family transcriptional regulator